MQANWPPEGGEGIEGAPARWQITATDLQFLLANVPTGFNYSTALMTKYVPASGDYPEV